MALTSHAWRLPWPAIFLQATIDVASSCALVGGPGWVTFSPRTSIADEFVEPFAARLPGAANWSPGSVALERQSISPAWVSRPLHGGGEILPSAGIRAFRPDRR